MKKIVGIICILLIAACSSTKRISSKDPNVQRGQAKFGSYTASDFKTGKADFEDYCGTCHALKDPTSQTEAEWNSIVPSMTAKVNKRAGSEVLNTEHQELVLKYVLVMCTAPSSN